MCGLLEHGVGAQQERSAALLARALRARPAGSDPLSIVDYLYVGLPSRVFTTHLALCPLARLIRDAMLSELFTRPLSCVLVPANP
jgi:hypothetical protein